MKAALHEASAHEHYSADCFNRTWELMEKPDRTAEEDEEMFLAAHASLWHWSQRSDYAPEKRAVGHWQLSRVNCLTGRGESALAHARLALEAARDLNALSATSIAADMPPAATDTIPAGVGPDAHANGADGEEPAFLLGYAHEAMARANHHLGDEEAAEFHRAEAWRLADEVVDDETRERLLADLDDLRRAREAA